MRRKKKLAHLRVMKKVFKNEEQFKKSYKTTGEIRHMTKDSESNRFEPLNEHGLNDGSWADEPVDKKVDQENIDDILVENIDVNSIKNVFEEKFITKSSKIDPSQNKKPSIKETKKKNSQDAAVVLTTEKISLTDEDIKAEIARAGLERSNHPAEDDTSAIHDRVCLVESEVQSLRSELKQMKELYKELIQNYNSIVEESIILKEQGKSVELKKIELNPAVMENAIINAKPKKKNPAFGF